MIPAAKRLGDVALLRQGYAALLRRRTEELKDPANAGRVDQTRTELFNLLSEMAGTIAMLTGDRAEAASILRLAYQVSLDGAKPEDRAKVQEWIDKEGLPAWFPPGDPKSIAPAEINKLAEP